MSDPLDGSPALAEQSTIDPGTAEATPEKIEGAAPAPAKVETKEDPVQKRFDRLTKEKYDAQRRADRLEWELEQARRQPAKTEPVAPEAPTLESSGFDDAKYQQAQAEYTKAMVRAEAQRILKEEREQQTEQAKASEFDKRQADFAKSTPDYAEKVTENDELPISELMANAIRKIELGPQVAYYLADNIETATLIAQLRDPIDVGREIGRIEARLEKKAAPTPKVSSAPAPPAKIDATEPAVEKLPEKMSDAEFAKWRRRQIADRKPG